MSPSNKLAEIDLGPAVLSLFPFPDFVQMEQVPLGRKRIDLFFIRSEDNLTISVELKIADWKTALWQAVVNFQICNESYIAIWHDYIHRAENNLELIQEYGVGLIVVEDNTARIVAPSARRARHISPANKLEWYRHLIASPKSV